MRYFIVILACFSLAGCNLDEAIARAESATKTAQAVAEKAEITLKATENAIVVAKSAVAQAETIAAATGNEQAKKAVETAKQALLTAEAVLPSVQSAAADAKQALLSAEAGVAAAKAAKEAGGSAWQVVVAAIGGFIPAVLPAIKLFTALNQTRTALKLTAAHADAMEKAETDEDVAIAKANAAQSQVAAGVHDLIQTIRKG